MQKTMGTKGKRLVALILALTMLMSLAACGKRGGGESAAVPEQTVPAAEAQQPLPEAETPEEQAETPRETPQDTAQSAPLPVEEDRESLEAAVELLGGSQPVEDLTDEELNDLVEDLIEDLEENKNTQGVENLGDADAPIVNIDPDAYEEDGTMNTPFDQVYPELIESGAVEFDDETLLIKMSNSHGGALTSGLQAAGVAALEAIVPMEKQTWYEAKLIAGTDAQKALASVRTLDEVLLAEYNYVVETSAIDEYKHFDDKTDKEFQKNGHNKDQWHMHHCGIPDGYVEMAAQGGSASVIVAVIDTGVDYDHEDLSQNIWVNSAEIPGNNIDDDNNGYIDDYYGVDLVADKGNGDDDNGHGTHVAGIIAAQNNNLGTVGIAYNTKIMPIKAATHSGTLNQATIAKAVQYAYENGAEVINMSFGGTACSIAVQDALAVAYSRCVLVASAGNSGYPNEPVPGWNTMPNYPAALTYVLGVSSVDQYGYESYFTNWDPYPFSGAEYEVAAPGNEIMSTLPNDTYGFLSGTSMAAPIVSAIAAILRSEFGDRDTYPTPFIYGQIASTSEYTAICGNKDHVHKWMPSIVNLHDALTKLPVPELGVQDYALFDTQGLSGDTAGANNGDGVVDAGETIALGLTLQNRWGQSKNTQVTLDTLVNGISDPYVEILNPTVDYGSLGTYATGDCGGIYTNELLTGWEDPFYIKLADNCPNDYLVTLNVTITCGNDLDTEDSNTYTFQDAVTLSVRNGVILPSVIDEDMTLTADNLYIIPSSTVIEAGVTVKVMPGTHIQFWSDDAQDPYADSYIAYLRVEGDFLVEGTREDPVYIYPSQLMDRYNVEIGEGGAGYVSLKYADITNFASTDVGYEAGNSRTGNTISYAEHCTFRINYGSRLLCRAISSGVVSWRYIGTPCAGHFRQAKDCVFYKIGNTASDWHIQGAFDRCAFVDCGIAFEYYDSQWADLRDCLLLGNSFVDQTKPSAYKASTLTVDSSPLKNWAAEDIEICYWEGTGSTYVFSTDTISSHNDMIGQIRAIGGDYAIAQDPEEWAWLSGKMQIYSASYQLGVTYDRLGDRYLWADGTPVGDFVPTEGGPTTTESYCYYQYAGLVGRIISTSSNNGSCVVYEIPGYILPETISFAAYTAVTDLDTTYQLAPLSAPAQLPLEAFLYESSDESILTVDEKGLVTPVAQGTANVTVYSLDKAVSNYITLTVKDYVPLEGLAFPAATVQLPVGQSWALVCTLTPENTTRRNVAYTSSNPGVVTVDTTGKLTGVASGTATVTATCEGLTATVAVTVFQKATALTLEPAVAAADLSQGTMALPTVGTSAGAETKLTWYSSDPEVAQVAEGSLALKRAGVTTLVVTDENSGLSAEQTVYVTEQALSPVVKLDIAGGCYYALRENGKLYMWSSATSPVCILENVRDFDGSGSVILVLFEDNTVALGGYSSGAWKASKTYTDFTEMAPAGVAYCDNNYYVYTEDGLCYAWGYNTYGQLGIGNKTTSQEPALVALDAAIRQVEAFYLTAAFLTEEGELYVAGGHYLQAASPIWLAEDVTELRARSQSIDFRSAGEGMYFGSYNQNAEKSSISLSQFDKAAHDNNNYAIGLEGDRLSVCDFGIWKDLSGAWAVTALACDNGTWWFATEDGFLYGLGANGTGQLGGGAVGNTTEPVLIPLENTAEQLTLTGSNLNDGVLTEDALVLTFNKGLAGVGTVTFTEAGSQTTCTATCKHNTLTVSRSAGFREQTEYTLTIPVANLHGAGNSAPEAEIVVTFTWQSGQEESDAAAETPVVHESTFDETVERIYTPESLYNALLENQTRNDRFCGNAILNPITTDTTVSHWLRPSTKDGMNGEEVFLAGNWWGTVDQTAIERQMVDYRDFVTYGKFVYEPYLTQAPENTFPFVTGVSVLDQYGAPITTAGNQEITVRVTFNRDMDTTIPLRVTFGAAYPYADYEVTQGSYVDARTWEGTYFISTVIGNGDQFFAVSNGCSAADALELLPDSHRFMFHIDTTAAQALIMQGNATDTGIQLTWTQDDYDTLMGYNVYRSTDLDGYYQRLNSVVIPADTREFFDDTVEPGVVYYYNFTVVQTDLTESVPSGKISIMSKDTMAPNIYHTPVYTATMGQNLIISAQVTDNLSIAYANVRYRTTGQTEWKTVRMNALNDKYSAIIPAGELSMEGFEYYIEAFDGVSFTYRGSEETPFAVTVKEALDVNALGDVDGNGAISNLDALMLLQALAGKLNLSDEAFARADLNQDGKLSAVEALRILHYVTGKVGSLDMTAVS